MARGTIPPKSEHANPTTMKQKRQERNYRKTIRFKETEHRKLVELLRQSAGCQNLSELLRSMLFDRAITLDTRNASMEEIREELSQTKTAIHKIGVNINQLVHYFHAHPDPKNKRFYARKVMPLYAKVGGLVSKLLLVLDQLSKRPWS
nr:mobilization protein MobC [Echinicola vietnamensis]